MSKQLQTKDFSQQQCQELIKLIAVVFRAHNVAFENALLDIDLLQ